MTASYGRRNSDQAERALSTRLTGAGDAHRRTIWPFRCRLREGLCKVARRSVQGGAKPCGGIRQHTLQLAAGLRTVHHAAVTRSIAPAGERVRPHRMQAACNALQQNEYR